MKSKVSLLSVLICLVFSSPCTSQGFLKVQDKDIVDASGAPVILRGMGLGGWMLQEGYMLQTAGFANAQHKIRQKIEDLIGKSSTDAFYEQWLANHVTRTDIDSLKSWGFNSVRLPMHYNLYTLPSAAEPVPGQHTWLDQGFILTDSLISWCRQNGMFVILDLHAAPGGQGKDEGISDYDPTKPSLWESKPNRDKTVALWRRLAERYADEPWIAGYDLINEPNWPLDNNGPLRAIYEEITTAIREVDQNHIIFIEGNWFANDFTGLTPPWDDNMVYSPHKYWSFNDQASIQWVLDIRENYNVPLYFGESGENSNVWFRDAIRLIESHNIGWAWWPMKKIESIAGPLSVVKTEGYQRLLDYWNNGGVKPGASEAKSILMELTDLLKIEKCIYQKDVIDAMFRQVSVDEAVPFRTQAIPGIVYATDFDMGGQDVAYHDTETANYQVSTGNYTAWNNGWSYRNDGVDIERTSETLSTNGYNVGWLVTGEWMQYDVHVADNAVYDIKVRVAANDDGGAFHFEMNGSDITGRISVPGSGGWQQWSTVLVRDVVLDTTDTTLRFIADQEGYNLSSFEFIQKGASTDLATRFVSATTLDENHIQLNLNKPVDAALLAYSGDFSLIVNNVEVAVAAMELKEGATRALIIRLDEVLQSSDDIRISYTGMEATSRDGGKLETFSRKLVTNNIAKIHDLPGRIQMEDYFFQSGVQLENTNDIGGGQNIGFLDQGDYLDYYINVPNTGTYSLAFRTAALSERGGVVVQLVASDGTVSVLKQVEFASTGDWQNWITTSVQVSLSAGQHQLRIAITKPLFNMNWMEFSLTTAVEELDSWGQVRIYPNPARQSLYIQVESDQGTDVMIQVSNQVGQTIYQKRMAANNAITDEIDVSTWSGGIYIVSLFRSNGDRFVRKMIKVE